MTDDHHAAGAPEPPDPAVATALERTRADLAAHGDRTPPMPGGLLADIDAALAAERGVSPPDGPPHDAPGDPPRTPGPAVSRPRPRAVGPAAAVSAAAAAAVAAVIALVVGGLTTVWPAPAHPTPAPIAAPGSSPDIPVLGGGDGLSALRAGLGRSDYGPLADPGRLAGCLDTHGVPVGARPVGARKVVVDGRAGVLLVLPTGVAARFRLLVVEPGCAAGAPLTLSDTFVGR